MKFDVVIGNPPYQEDTNDFSVDHGRQKRVRNIFQEFQILADSICLGNSCLIYPGKRWIHFSGKGMKKFGVEQLNSSSLSKLIFIPYADKIFNRIDVADGISIVIKNYKKENKGFEYEFIDGDNIQKRFVEAPGSAPIALIPYEEKIANKLKRFMKTYSLPALSESDCINQKLFRIESDFVEKNPDLVKSFEGQQIMENEIKLFTNDKGGKMGRAKWYITNRNILTVNQHLIDKWKVIVSSANAGGQKRSNQMEIIDNYSVFGRSRIALKMFNTEDEAKNCFKYLNSKIIKFCFLLTDEALSSLAQLVPDLNDYSKDSIINFKENIDIQLFKLIDLTEEEYQYIISKVEK